MNTTTQTNQSINCLDNPEGQTSSDRASRGMDAQARQGAWVSRVPLGYVPPRYAGQSIQVDTEKAELIRLAFGLAASPSASLREALVKVTALGLTSHSGKPISLSSLHHLLSNPFYAGKIRYKGEVLAGKHQAIVPPELFERVQANLVARRCR